MNSAPTSSDNPDSEFDRNGNLKSSIADDNESENFESDDENEEKFNMSIPEQILLSDNFKKAIETLDAYLCDTYGSFLSRNYFHSNLYEKLELDNALYAQEVFVALDKYLVPVQELVGVFS
jgi:hypothetical protein